MTLENSKLGETDIVYVGFVLGHGGDAVQMLDLARGMSDRGLRVKIVVPEMPSTESFAERAASLGVHVVRTPYIKADAHSSRQNLLHLIRLFREHPARVYHIHTGDVCLPRLVPVALNLLQVSKVIVTVHSPYDSLTPGDARARYWAYTANRQLFRVVCPSAHSRATQLTFGLQSDKVQVIYNSVDTDRFSNGVAQNARNILGFGSERRIILFSSRLEGQKRPLEAVRAFSKIAAANPDVDLVFVGRGALEPDARALAESLGLKDRVHFAGFQQNVHDWLAAASIWILPTESENFSLAVLEALAAGCPMVTTNCPGNDEVLVNEENALMVEVGDVDAMVNGLSRILSDEAFSRGLSENARKTGERFALSRMIDQYAVCYNECLGVAGASVTAPISS
jgi:glycosyltransferase involved in cell wall biosynthesis